MVVLILDKGVERAVYGIVLAGLDLKGDGGKAAVIVDQVIDLALAAVVIVVQQPWAASSLATTVS